MCTARCRRHAPGPWPREPGVSPGRTSPSPSPAPPVPIRTNEGWLAIYHGVDRTCNGYIYRLGVMLLDLEDPSRIIARGGMPVLWPDRPYEMQGRVPNVTFGCNALLEPDGTVRIYYGAADTCVGLATAKLDDLIAACRRGNPVAETFFSGKKQKSRIEIPEYATI